MRTYHRLIKGQEVKGLRQQILAVINPVPEKTVGDRALAEQTDGKATVATAQAIFSSWATVVTALWTKILVRWLDSCRRIEVGTVDISIPVPTALHSFKDWKNFIFSGSGMQGIEGVYFFTELKIITSRWLSGIRQGVEFSLPIVE
jgi:acyl-CoA reductase-like NAD-dependent aldehyde dehydrogenase